jgi:hypothetical protein
MPRRKAEEKRVAVIDAETDPFRHGREPKAFAWGYFDGETYRDFWGDDSTDQLLAWLESIEAPLMLYAHNGGKFDFFYLLRKGALTNPLKIIGGRIVKAGMGIHELRDSFSIIPIPLGKYKKETIDYELFERERRERHRKEILHYLAVDCESLYELVSAFVNRFGPRLTIGATALGKISELHPFERCKQNHDEQFRPFYFGGRVECFEAGIIKGNWRVYDVNSMYPHVMRNYLHPTGETYMSIANASINARGDCELFGARPYFAHIRAESAGALPIRRKDADGEGLDFPRTSDGEFLACSHEIRKGLELGLLKIHEVVNAWVPRNTISFGAFVDQYIAEKIAAAQSGDEIAYWFAKFLLNSGYGKFGQDPNNYRRYEIMSADDHARRRKLIKEGWSLFADYGSWEIWQRPDPKPVYYDVAISASVTSAGRAELLQGIYHAMRPIYCDTDGLICLGLYGGTKIDATELGAWKCEVGESTEIAIAGKKLYALMNGSDCVKLASKGAKMKAADIFAVARGEKFLWQSPAPNFKLDGEVRFIERTIEATTHGTITKDELDRLPF